MEHDRLNHHLQELIFADFLHALDLVRIGTAPDEAFRSHEARVRPLRDMARHLETTLATAPDTARLEDFVLGRSRIPRKAHRVPEAVGKLSIA